jgi:hypothetical protein
VARHAGCGRRAEAEGSAAVEGIDQGQGGPAGQRLGQPVQVPDLREGRRRSGDRADLAGRTAFHHVHPAHRVGVPTSGDDIEVGKGVCDDSGLRGKRLRGASYMDRIGNDGAGGHGDDTHGRQEQQRLDGDTGCDAAIRAVG